MTDKKLKKIFLIYKKLLTKYSIICYNKSTKERKKEEKIMMYSYEIMPNLKVIDSLERIKGSEANLNDFKAREADLCGPHMQALYNRGCIKSVGKEDCWVQIDEDTKIRCEINRYKMTKDIDSLIQDVTDGTILQIKNKISFLNDEINYLIHEKLMLELAMHNLEIGEDATQFFQ